MTTFNHIVRALLTNTRPCLLSFPAVVLTQNSGWSTNPKTPHLRGGPHLPPSSVHISSPAKSVSMTIAREAAMTSFTTVLSHLWGHSLALCFFYVRSSGQGSLGKMLWEPTLIKSLFYKPLWACLPSYNNAAYTSKSSIFISTSLPGLSFMCWHHIVEQMLSGGIYSFDCFVSCLTTCGPLCPPPPYSQTSPNTCMALKEQFDLSPCVVIGGPGLVIHGPFDCWHVKCSVPIPKAESWFARSFRFQLFDLRPGSYYWLLMYLQAAKRLPLAHLAAAC